MIKMPQTATLTERIANIPQAVWNRRGSIAQAATGIAKVYIAWKLYNHFRCAGSFKRSLFL